MSSFEFNKILAAILLAAIIIVIIGLVGDFFINNNKKAGQQTAYKIEIPESNSEIAASASQEINIEPVEALLSTSSIKNGQKIFKKCGACHTYEKDCQQKIGPNLWNVINRKKGAIEGFAYSNALLVIEFLLTVIGLNSLGTSITLVIES